MNEGFIAVSTKVEFLRVNDLVPFDRNTRTHSEAQVAQIAASIKEFGFTNPILVDEVDIIIAGEGRWRAAKKLKMETVPCIVLVGLTATQKAAYVIADNKLALNSGWDTDMLVAELGRLHDQNFDIDLAGFSEVEILDLGFNVDTELANFAMPNTPQSSEPTSSDVTPGASASQPAAGEAQHKDWSGMPEFHQPDNRPFRSVIVHMLTEEAADAFAELIGQNITEKTKYVFFPKQERTDAKKEVYA